MAALSEVMCSSANFSCVRRSLPLASAGSGRCAEGALVSPATPGAGKIPACRLHACYSQGHVSGRSSGSMVPQMSGR